MTIHTLEMGEDQIAANININAVYVCLASQSIHTPSEYRICILIFVVIVIDIFCIGKWFRYMFTTYLVDFCYAVFPEGECESKMFDTSLQ